MIELPALQEKLLRCLVANMNKDVKIDVLYAAVYGFDDKTTDIREMQQRLGPHITRINRKLPTGTIVPGELKRTYRLGPKQRDKA